MNKSLFIIVLMTVVCNGNHPTPILDALIYGASKLRSRIQNAGSFIDNITHRHGGGSVNIEGNFESDKDHEHYIHPPQPPGPGPIGYGPGPNGYNRPGPNGYGPGPNSYGLMPNGPGPNGYGYVPRPNENGPGPNGFGAGLNNYGPGPIGYGPGPNGYGHDPNNHDNNRPNYGQNEHNYNEYNDKRPSQYDHDYKKDEPIHVPINPNEVYADDKNDNNSPKREAKNEEADDEEYNIDIRFNKDAK